MTSISLLMDFAFASILIAVGQLLRAKVKFFQKFFVPASLIAGFFGLALGSQGLNIIPFSDVIGSYAGVLVIIIFAAVGLNGFSVSTKGIKNDIGRVYGMFSILTMGTTLQIIFGVAFSILFISKVAPVNNGFGLILLAGFTGGHGTAAAIGSTFTQLGWTDGLDLAMTSATVGILAGIFGGLIFIKWAAKKGYTHYIKDFSYITGDLKTGLIPPENRSHIGKETISSTSLDPLAFHTAWVLIASGLGYLINSYIKKSLGIGLPDFLISFLVGFAMFFIFGGRDNTSAYKYIDRKIISKINGTAADYLVFFGVASVKISVIVSYALPLALLMIFGIIITIAYIRLLAPAFMNESWFERSMLPFGLATGVFAIGFILFRIVDPNNESKTMSDFVIANPFLTPIQSFAYAAGPYMLLGGQHWKFVGIYTVITIAVIAVAIIFKWWYIKVPLEGRKPVDNV